MTHTIDARLCVCKHPAFVHMDVQPDTVKITPIPGDLGRCVSCPSSISDGGCKGFAEQPVNPLMSIFSLFGPGPECPCGDELGLTHRFDNGAGASEVSRRCENCGTSLTAKIQMPVERDGS